MPSLDNITWERLQREHAVTYPCDAEDKPGNEIVFGSGFPTASGRCETAIGTQLIGEEAMVQSAFSNLVDNAAKYTPAEGSMFIRWWADQNGAHERAAGYAEDLHAHRFPPSWFIRLTVQTR